MSMKSVVEGASATCIQHQKDVMNFVLCTSVPVTLMVNMCIVVLTRCLKSRNFQFRSFTAHTREGNDEVDEARITFGRRITSVGSTPRAAMLSKRGIVCRKCGHSTRAYSPTMSDMTPQVGVGSRGSNSCTSTSGVQLHV